MNTNIESVVIVAARRTPIGAFQGALAPVSASDLSAAATTACIDGAGIDAADIDEAIIGCVLPAGIGRAPARQAALAAGYRERGIPVVMGGAHASLLPNEVLGFSDAVVVGVPDDKFGEAVTVVVALHADQSATVEEITAATTGHLAGFKRPRHVVFVDAIPRGPHGKADYHWAKEQARAQLS